MWYGYNQTQSSLNNKLFVIRIRRKYWSYIFKSDSDIYVYSDNIRDLEAFLNMEVTFIFKPWYSKVSLASKGSRIAERGRDARGRKNNTTIVRMDKLPTGSMIKNGGRGANHETGI